jgi:hypothetical protein
MLRCSPAQPTRTHAAASAMRRVLAGVVLAATLIPASASVSAEERIALKDGDKLYGQCAAPAGGFSQGLCYGYIVSIVDPMGAGASIGGFSACIRVGVMAEQAADVVKQFIGSHPEQRHLPAAWLVAARPIAGVPLQAMIFSAFLQEA